MFPDELALTFKARKVFERLEDLYVVVSYRIELGSTVGARRSIEADFRVHVDEMPTDTEAGRAALERVVFETLSVDLADYALAGVPKAVDPE